MIHYTAEQLSGFPWIASADTLKTEDLLPKFWSVAEDLAVRSSRPDLLSPDLLATLTKLAGEDSDHDAWDETETSTALSELFDVLNNAAPCGFSFGASEGDGACFGFWLSEDWAEALEYCGIAADSDPDTVAPIVAQLDASGVTPDNVEDTFQGEAEGYSEEEAGVDYAAQLAEEIGAWDGRASWPYTCIDWEAAWRELETGDGYSLLQWSHARWLVFRFC